MKLQCKSCPALASTVLPYPSLHWFVQPTLPTLSCCVILTLLLVLTWSINWWNIQQKYGNFLNFIAFFSRYLLTPSATLSFTPSCFWKWNVLRWYIVLSWYICHVSFIYIWLLVPKFSIWKCFGNCRKHHFRLVLGGFLALPNSLKYSKLCFLEILTSDAIQGNASDMSLFWNLIYLTILRNIKRKQFQRI